MSITEAKEETGEKGGSKEPPPSNNQNYRSKMDRPLSSDRSSSHRNRRSRSRSRSRGRDNYHHQQQRHWRDNRRDNNNRGRYEDERYSRERSRDRNGHDNRGGGRYHRNDEYEQRGGGDHHGRYSSNNQHGPPHAVTRNDQRNNINNNNSHHQAPPSAAAATARIMPTYKINPNIQPDPNLQQIISANDVVDPRGSDPTKRITQTAKRNGTGRNTESFDPASTLVRPDLRVWVGNPSEAKFTKPLKHDDVVIIPELFGPESNWDIYYALLSEMQALQSNNVRGSEWISWHEGAHLISKNPVGSPTFERVIDRLCEYFSIRKKSVGTRFNWYRDSSDWKPFHHDSAAYNPKRAKDQNITVGVSFGSRRELAFLHATPQTNGDKCKIYFPQTNNGVFSFGRDVNIQWKHGVNALAEEEQDGKGRISIVLWGLAEGVIEEGGSPPLLGSDGQGPHAQQQSRDGHNRGGNHHGRRNNRGRR